MSRISLGYFVIAGLLLWGLPAYFVVGPPAFLYTTITVLPVWCFARGDSSTPVLAPRPTSLATCIVLASFTLMYVGCDAIFGNQLLAINMFLFPGVGGERYVEAIVKGVSQGGGVAYLLGNILALLPFALIDAVASAPRIGRFMLWGAAVVAIFYSAGEGRGTLMMAVMAVALGRSSNWHRLLTAAGLALGIFFTASLFRGDFAHATQNPLIEGIVGPYINLGLLLNANCGHAPWYSFILEFLKKFLPSFLVPKTIFSFNAEMSWCINPTDANFSNGISVFGWLGEILYYTPSLLTSLIAGLLLAILVRAVNRQFLKQRLFTARLLAGLIYLYLPRSRTQDVFSYLIAQFLFLVFVWPQLLNLLRNLRRLLPHPRPASVPPQAHAEPSL